MSPIKGFFAYPSKPPACGDAIGNAVEEINNAGEVCIKTWEECKVTGRVIIDEICREIDAAQFFCADLTGINPNVMFELGYAIAKNKQIWLVLDPSLHLAKQNFNRLKMLTTIGYHAYHNSKQIVDGFYRDRPYENLNETIFQQSILPSLSTSNNDLLLYVKSRHDSEASVKISLRVGESKLSVKIDDPSETLVQPLVWYAQQAHGAAGVVCHLTGHDREDHQVLNAKASFVAGLAHGFGRPLIMLSESDYLQPTDYRDLVRDYKSSAVAYNLLDQWLAPIEKANAQLSLKRSEYLKTLLLANELQKLDVGEYIAENESSSVDSYFIETSAYAEALGGTTSVFVGRKGVGKTSTLFKLESSLKEDRRNLVVVIKPVAYEVQGVIRLLASYKERDSKGFAVESLWKFLVLSEIANAAILDYEARPWGDLNDVFADLLYFVTKKHPFLREPFSIRLNRCVESLFASQDKMPDGAGLSEVRLAISESLHKSILNELRSLLVRFLAARKRVAVLIDNLDKGWDKEHDLAVLAEVVLGLLSSAQRLGDDFLPRGTHQSGVNVTLSLFVRSDIFFRVLSIAREPDKIRYSRMTWSDPELLIRVVEDRIAAAQGGAIEPRDIWEKFVVPEVCGIPARQYFLSKVMPRPRDLLFFFKEAVNTAINRKHIRVEEADIRDAERRYSQFVLNSLTVESWFEVSDFEKLMYPFLGGKQLMTQSELENAFAAADIATGAHSMYIDLLCSLGFLGLEVKNDEFRFSSDAPEQRKNSALAVKYSANVGMKRYLVHPSVCSELEIQIEPRFVGTIFH